MKMMQQADKVRLGLLGHPLGHSFSAAYFQKKFEKEGLQNFEYLNFDFADLSEGVRQLKADRSCRGFNVTIPYKQQIVSFLDECSPEAQAIGAVNTVKIGKDGRWTGYNTDYIGFYESLRAFCMEPDIPEALVLGNGGASQAVQYALYSHGIPYTVISRNPESDLSRNSLLQNVFSYRYLPAGLVFHCRLLINTTKLGMFPDTESCPEIPYNEITERHYAFDLVYNPEQTAFMRHCAQEGAKVVNGLEMLHLQAEAAWKIWTA